MSTRIVMILACALGMATGCDSCDNPTSRVDDVEQLHAGGAPSSAWDVVIIGDGYSESEQNDYKAEVRHLVAGLLDIEPFSNESAQRGFNITRIDLVALDDEISPLDCHIDGEDQPARYIEGSADSCLTVCERSRRFGLTGHDVIVVLVDSDTYAAWTDLTNHISYITDSYAAVTTDPHRGSRILSHELGHSIAGLGDEYTCRICAPGVDEDHPYPEEWKPPPEPNLTSYSELDHIPWKDQIPEDTNAPIADTNPCSSASPVYRYEGGGYYLYGIYRPQQHCRMDGGMCADFCAVCKKVLKAALLEGQVPGN